MPDSTCDTGIYFVHPTAMVHCLWSCLMCSAMPSEDAMAIAELHEVYNTQNYGAANGSLLCGQDMHNNRIGCECAASGDCPECCFGAYYTGLLSDSWQTATGLDVRTLRRKYFKHALDLYNILNKPPNPWQSATWAKLGV